MNLFDILPWWSWLFGALGLGGLVLLIVLAPVAADVAEKAIAAVVGRMLQTRWGVAIIVGAISLFIGHLGGGLYVERKCQGRLESQRLAAEQAGKTRDITIAARTQRKYAPVIQQLTTRADARTLEADSYEKKLMAAMAAPSGKPSGSCQLGADALQLRQR